MKEEEEMASPNKSAHLLLNQKIAEKMVSLFFFWISHLESRSWRKKEQNIERPRRFEDLEEVILRLTIIFILSFSKKLYFNDWREKRNNRISNSSSFEEEKKVVYFWEKQLILERIQTLAHNRTKCEF